MWAPPSAASVVKRMGGPRRRTATECGGPWLVGLGVRWAPGSARAGAPAWHGPRLGHVAGEARGGWDPLGLYPARRPGAVALFGVWSCALGCDLGCTLRDLSWAVFAELVLGGIEHLAQGQVKMAVDGSMLPSTSSASTAQLKSRRVHPRSQPRVHDQNPNRATARGRRAR